MKETPKYKVPIATIAVTKAQVEFDSDQLIADRFDKSIDSIDSGTDTDTTINNTTATTTASPPPASFVIKCLLRTARFMWQVTTIPAKIGDTIGTLYRYAQDSVDSFLCVAG